MTVSQIIRGMAYRANPMFAIGVVVIPILALGLGSTIGSREIHTYVHVMAGVLWTGIDLFMALVIGPVLGGLSLEERSNWFEKFTPKMAFLMPTLATVTIFSGITLATRIGVFPNAGPWIGMFVVTSFVPAALVLGWVFAAFRDWRWQVFFAIVVVGNGAYFVNEFVRAGLTIPGTTPVIMLILSVMIVLTVQGFGLLLPTEVLIYLEMMTEDPDTERIGELGMRNAKLSGVQGVFQLAIIVLMVYLRWTPA